MGRSVAVIVQFVLFLLTFLVGSLFLHPFGIRTTLASDPAHLRSFQWDGLLLMLVLYVLVLGLEALTRKLRTAALGSTLAVVLAMGAGLLMKFGFVTMDR